MNTKARITSIQRAISLDSSITGFPSFHLSSLKLAASQTFELPTNLRLGHLAERVIAELIKASENFTVLYENLQVIEENNTIGELDFIVQNKSSSEILHLELAYKFYLLDPSISDNLINNWIGPNRNDSLSEKLNKLQQKQFPLLHHRGTKALLKDLDVNSTSQALCLLTSLYIPYGFQEALPSAFAKTIKGYYLDYNSFTSLDSSNKLYFLPQKKEWGMDPSENETWLNISEIEGQLRSSLTEKRALLCWQTYEGKYSEFFVTWW